MPDSFDAVVVGSGPNGLAAAITLARHGLSVQVVEAAPEIGGGLRSAELTLPGFVHDVCATVHPLALASPFLSSLPLAEHGLEMAHPEVPLAHPLDDGRVVALDTAIPDTAARLGRDADAYSALMTPLVEHAPDLMEQFLGPLRLPRHPVTTAQFGLQAIRSARGLASMFESDPARALIAGLAAHSILPLDRLATGGFGLVLGLLGHAVGWPVVRGGSRNLARALQSYLESLGGRIVTGCPVTHLDDLPAHRAVLLDLDTRQLAQIAGHRLSRKYLFWLRRYRHGPGVFKVDWALQEAVPWTHEPARRAGTIHLGGTFEQIAASERAMYNGHHVPRPFCIVVQPTVADPSRAPEGRHVLWGYCHVPAGYRVDMTAAIEEQIERAAPGFGDLVLARSTMDPRDFAGHNANYVGGDINGGVQDLRQLFTRPVPRLDPYATPADGVFLCSSSTPPGGGVHGMCGHHAARSAIRRHFA